jgi:hypothetical protein
MRTLVGRCVSPYNLDLKTQGQHISVPNKISFERGPQGERGPGLEASKINFDRVFACV